MADNVIDAPEIVIADGGNDMADRLPFIEDADLKIRHVFDEAGEEGCLSRTRRAHEVY